MRPNDMLLRCYAKRDGDLWVAFCLDLSLGTQADTLEEAKQKLDDQIREYVHDALAGDDRKHAEYLLSRRAPLSFWLEYWAVKAAFKFSSIFATKNSSAPRSKPFKEVLPLVPAAC